LASTLNELYLKYVNKVGSTLEKDKYFQYLFNLIASGKNELTQTNQILHKVVDEEWLTTVEEVLDPLFRIVENPKKFIETEEELVPASLAKKISSESVRHLSQNTQFLEPNDEDDEVHPSKILNVSHKETLNLYENRFVYCLIKRLFAFIDKRTNIIFWSTGDETRNHVAMETQIEDGYEQIQYKIEMNVKKSQSYAENDADNMNVFMRIDRVRRLVFGLRSTTFYKEMGGTQPVRSPIQKTNAIIKNVDYRACYKLWQFLDRYDDIGYTIEVQDEAMAFDEEYVNQMYIGMINNYMVFKSILDSDERNIDTQARPKKTLKPKFLKKVEEVFVDEFNVEDVEIRKILIQEVTQAQLDAEAALEKKIEELEQALTELSQTQHALEKAKVSEAAANELRESAEKRLIEADTKLGDMSKQLDDTIHARDIAINNENAAKNKQLAAEMSRDEYVAKSKETAQKLRDYIAELKEAQAERVEKEREAKALAKEQLAAERKAKTDALSQAEQIKKEALAEAEKVKKEALAEAEKIQKEAIEQAQKLVKEAEDRASKAEKDQAYAELAKKNAEEAKKSADDARKQAELERDEAIKRDENNRLGKYIVKTLRGKKNEN